MADVRGQALRSIPSVNALLGRADIAEAAAQIEPQFVTNVVRNEVDRVRENVLAGDGDAVAGLTDRIVKRLQTLNGSSSRIVINGTGVVIQTNLGRAPVSTATAQAMSAAASNYLALETDLESGDRGGRGSEIESMMQALTGAERTLVVNNNAAAVMLALTATSASRSVIVSRGEAVEIGGGFRIPDVLRQSGARLVEVGTTNRTYVADYAAAIDADTAALLRVHASNFEISGFVAHPELAEIAALARSRGVLAIEDVGSGCLVETTMYGLAHEPTLAESIASGVDIVCASGDKLLGGPQAGLILGRAEVVDTIRRHPLARALRADKTCLAGIEATLRHYVRGEAEESIPVWWSISRSESWLEERAGRWSSAIGPKASVIPTQSVVGGGSLPGKTLNSFAIALETGAPDALARRLRLGTPHIFPRVVNGAVAIDARTVLPDQDDQLVSGLKHVLA